MNWLFFALSAQFTWAIVNHFDKHLVNKYFNGGVGAMMIFTAFVNSIFLPFILFFNQQILDTPLIQILLASSVGACYVIGSIFYLYALRKEETTNISILWQFSVPVTYLLGYIFLRETLSTQQIIGALIVLTGGLVTMVKIDNK
ncbi:MAG TPA: EamA family transporter, partial [Candidatus Dojkabacteria bacterium]|nr:EamA family transporter [Candidatus Dojkabacteria bacterium]